MGIYLQVYWIDFYQHAWWSLYEDRALASGQVFPVTQKDHSVEYAFRSHSFVHSQTRKEDLNWKASVEKDMATMIESCIEFGV